MINYEDVLLLKILTNGAFWCNENVYCIAKELQLLSLKLDDLFIGIGGFHTEKVLLVCCGLYLKDIESEISLLIMKYMGQ